MIPEAATECRSAWAPRRVPKKLPSLLNSKFYVAHKKLHNLSYSFIFINENLPLCCHLAIEKVLEQKCIKSNCNLFRGLLEDYSNPTAICITHIIFNDNHNEEIHKSENTHYICPMP